MSMAIMMPCSSALFFFFSRLLLICHAQQQPYTGNNCLGANDSSSLGYSCSGGDTDHSCPSYLTFRSTPPYQSPLEIAGLLAADAAAIAAANNLTDVAKRVPKGELLLVPTACSCTGGRYQHNASYTLVEGDTYFLLANYTYQGLTTCEALKAQNPYEVTNLTVGARLVVPLRCACPTADQVAGGIKYLLTYLITPGDTLHSIAQLFPADNLFLFVLMYPNNLTANSLLYPFSTLLVPLGSEPAGLSSSTTTAAAPLMAVTSGRVAQIIFQPISSRQLIHFRTISLPHFTAMWLMLLHEQLRRRPINFSIS